jgi:hypothetical protein
MERLEPLTSHWLRSASFCGSATSTAVKFGTHVRPVESSLYLKKEIIFSLVSSKYSCILTGDQSNRKIQGHVGDVNFRSLLA